MNAYFTAESSRIAVVAVALLSLPGLPQTARGCPFCTAVTNTFSEDIASADAAIIARLAIPPVPGAATSTSDNPSANLSMATFTIDKILKGEDVLGTTQSVSTPFFGDPKQGDMFLLLGSDARKLTWSPPMRLNDQQNAYLTKLMTLPKDGAGRLTFFQRYLEDPDPTLAQDAYDEFARAPYATLKQLKPSMDHDQLVKRIENPEMQASHRRLYLTMLGVCGSREDLPMLEKRMRRTDSQAKSGLDALIACYLTLRGPAGVELVEDLYLKKRDDNFSGDYADVYAAIMALRFHGSEGNVIPRERVLQAFAYLLDNPQMADLIIPDLARWGDWSKLGRLVDLFNQADAKSTWVRMPIINYVRACPRPEAKEVLKKFQEIDPEAVKRAMTFFPTLPGGTD